MKFHMDFSMGTARVVLIPENDDDRLVLQFLVEFGVLVCDPDTARDGAVSLSQHPRW